jgi:hypothetical protein
MNMLDLYHLKRRAVEEAPKRSRRELGAFSTRARRDRILGQNLDDCSWEIWTRCSQMSTPEEVDAYIENIHTTYGIPVRKRTRWHIEGESRTFLHVITCVCLVSEPRYS